MPDEPVFTALPTTPILSALAAATCAIPRRPTFTMPFAARPVVPMFNAPLVPDEVDCCAKLPIGAFPDAGIRVFPVPRLTLVNRAVTLTAAPVYPAAYDTKSAVLLCE